METQVEVTFLPLVSSSLLHTSHLRMFSSDCQIGNISGLTVIKRVGYLKTSPPLSEIRVKVISFKKVKGV